MQQFDEKKFKPPAPSWYDLKQLPRSSDGDVWDRERQHEFRSKIQLRVYYDAASYASDLQPSALPLRSQAIGRGGSRTGLCPGLSCGFTFKTV